MNFIKSDAGRSFSHKTETRDCTVRALAAARGWPYWRAHSLLEAMGRKPGQGLNFCMAAKKLGLEMRPELSRMRWKTLARQFPTGRFIVRVPRHVFAVVNGTVFDQNPPKDGQLVRMVYEVPSNEDQDNDTYTED